MQIATSRRALGVKLQSSPIISVFANEFVELVGQAGVRVIDADAPLVVGVVGIVKGDTRSALVKESTE
jgi:RNase P/RNase MRP subunit p29